MNGNKRFFLDTNTIIELLAGNQDVKNHLDSAEWVGTSAIIVAQAVKTKSKLITYDKEFKKIKDANLVLLEK